MRFKGTFGPVSGPYPKVPAGGTVDVLHGISVADPYRTLEDPDAEATRLWCAAQDELLAAWFDADPVRTRLAGAFPARVKALLPGFVGLPAPRGGRLFFERRRPDEDHPVLVVDGRVLVDPSAMSPDHTTTLDGWWPSPGGDRLAYVVSEGGTEETLLRVIDVDTGSVLDGPIVCGRGADLAWLPGGEEILYVRRLGDEQLPAGEGQFHRRVWRRRLGTPVGEDLLIFGEGRDKTAYYGVDVSHDGRWATVSVSLGTAPRNDVYVGEVPAAGVPAWAVVQEGEDVLAYPHIGFDGRLYLLTDRGAPRWKLAVARPERPDPADWRDLVPGGGGGPRVLRPHPRRPRRVPHSQRRRRDRRRRSPDRGAGRHARPSRPGQRGGGQPPRRRRRRLGLLRRPPDAVLRPARRPGRRRRVDRPSEVGGPARRRPDGRRVGSAGLGHVRRRDARADVRDRRRRAGAPRPTVLYGYGGFDVALTPAYSATVAAWVEAGGVWAIANLRGGSEFGESWHRAGCGP